MVDENWNPVDELDFVCLYNPAEEEAFYRDVYKRQG